MRYREEKTVADETRREYADGLERLIVRRQCEAAEERREYCKNIFISPERYREDFRKMLGWPLVDCKREGIPAVKTQKLSEEDGYTVYRMQFEVLDGLVMTGLYFEIHGEEKKPLVLVQHGGWGTPELVAGVYGNTQNYNRLLERVIARGVHAFAPQLLVWEKASEVPCNRASVDARLKRVGSSITAVELYGLSRILDYFEKQKNVSHFGMIGLSYGGFFTLLASALDTRLRAAVSSSYFNTRDRYPWSDWMWFRHAQKFDDAEIACMVYPRKLCIAIGERDELFDYKCGSEAYKRLLALSKDVGTDWLYFHGFDGDHEFPLNDAPIDWMIEELKET